MGYERTEYTGAVMDVGEGGIFLLMNDSPTLGKNATVRWNLDADTMCEATGWIKRVLPAPKGQGVGIEFGVANDVLLHYLHNLVTAPEAERAHLLGDIKNLVIQIV